MAETMVCLARNIRAVALAADSAIRRSGRKPIILEACGSSLQKIFATAIVGSKQHSDPAFRRARFSPADLSYCIPNSPLAHKHYMQIFWVARKIFVPEVYLFVQILMQLRVVLLAVIKSTLSYFCPTLSSFTGPKTNHPSLGRWDWILGHRSL